MKAIGKIAVLAMTLAMAFVLTACGGGASSSAASSASASASSASASASESVSASSESASASAASASASAASASASASAASADTYTNEFFGIEFDLAEGWAFSSADAMASFNSVLGETTKAQADMVAQNAEQGVFVMVIVEDGAGLDASIKTAEEYLKADTDKMLESLSGNGSYESSSATVTFQGIERELPAQVTTITAEGGAQMAIGEAVAEKDGKFFEVMVMGSSEQAVMDAFGNFKSTVA